MLSNLFSSSSLVPSAGDTPGDFSRQRSAQRVNDIYRRRRILALVILFVFLMIWRIGMHHLPRIQRHIFRQGIYRSMPVSNPLYRISRKTGSLIHRFLGNSPGIRVNEPAGSNERSCLSKGEIYWFCH